jgi:hypothetical protein
MKPQDLTMKAIDMADFQSLSFSSHILLSLSLSTQHLIRPSRGVFMTWRGMVDSLGEENDGCDVSGGSGRAPSDGRGRGRERGRKKVREGEREKVSEWVSEWEWVPWGVAAILSFFVVARLRIVIFTPFFSCCMTAKK